MSQAIAEGLEDIVVASSSICDVKGVEGRLIYRGIDIGDLAQKSTFEEVVYLLWNGDLPNRSELDKLSEQLRTQRALPAEIINLMQTLPKNAVPMDVVRTVVSALAMHDPDRDDNSPEANKRKAIRLVAMAPTIIASYNCIRNNQEVCKPRTDLSLAGNFLAMITGEQPDETQIRTMDVVLILNAEHELNASTFAARVTAATLADIYAAVVSAIGTLSGPLHGGANEQVMKMLDEIGEPENTEKFVRELLSTKGRRLMGFGHRVYRTKDPRAVELERMARELISRGGNTNYFQMSQTIERVAKEVKNLNPNVDFYSASVYHALGIPTDLFTPVFVISRMAGWTAHVLEQYAHNRLIRPRAEYIGPVDVQYVPIDQRN